ncbi:hypothetical protein [Albidovulum sp.]|uniref:hypothetical protein n=1 Tax=Albidovulum sp. TaxID=1872424 RepID=UPI0025BC98D2|nr:hypothetical protein [Defluviimonas sp.]
MHRKNTFFIAAAIAALTAFPAVAGGAGTPAPGEPSLDEVREATLRFADVNAALAEGYIRDPGDHCEVATMMGRPEAEGAMGIHYFRPDLLGITAPPNPRVDGNGTHTDFRQPAVLLYEPQEDGSLTLIGVENLVFKAAWEAAGNAEPPQFHGIPYDKMEDDPATALDEAHNFAPHYDRHVWVHRENPNGVFTPFNPMATCAHHKGHADHASN